MRRNFLVPLGTLLLGACTAMSTAYPAVPAPRGRAGSGAAAVVRAADLATGSLRLGWGGLPLGVRAVGRSRRTRHALAGRLLAAGGFGLWVGPGPLDVAGFREKPDPKLTQGALDVTNPRARARATHAENADHKDRAGCRTRSWLRSSSASEVMSVSSGSAGPAEGPPSVIALKCCLPGLQAPASDFEASGSYDGQGRRTPRARGVEPGEAIAELQ